jgi:hypothetical protein
VELNKLKANRNFADVKHLHTTVKNARWWQAAFSEFGFQLVDEAAHLDRFLLSRGAATAPSRRHRLVGAGTAAAQTARSRSAQT